MISQNTGEEEFTGMSCSHKQKNDCNPLALHMQDLKETNKKMMFDCSKKIKQEFLR